MPLWGNQDNSNSAPKFAGNLISKTPTTAVRDGMFGNTTSSTGGVFGVDAQETPANAGIAHPGWIYRTFGTGGRAGRVFNETLVAMGSFIGVDANDDAVIKDVTITITSSPANTTVVGANGTTFSVSAITSPNTAMTYQWQANTGAGYADLTNTGVYSNVTTSTLSISNATGLNNAHFRVNVSAATANTKTSKRAVLTVS